VIGGESVRKETMIALVKEEMIEVLKNLDSKNLFHVSEVLESQINILKAVSKGVFFESAAKKEEKDETFPLKKIEQTKKSETEQSVIKKTKERFQEKILDDGNIIHGIFHRMLRGGTVHTKKELYVPESICRQMDFHNDDLVEATYLKTVKNKPYYTYRLLKKNPNQSIEQREEITGIAIKKHLDLKRLYIELSRPQEDFPTTILLKDNDIDQFNLKEGDIIDYVCHPDDVMLGCVLWKHKVDPFPIIEEQSHKTASKRISPKKARRAFLPIFEGLNILTVGGNPSLTDYLKEEIEKRSGNFIRLRGYEKRPTMVAKIKSADIVVVYTEAISHEAMYLTKDICKKYEIVHTFTKNCGKNQFVKRISSLKKKLPQNNS